MSRDVAAPPFRADHVGSLLRPQELLAAREQHKQGRITPAELRQVEDQAIRGAVALQESVGLRGVTDGEFRRTYFHIDFLEHLEGVVAHGVTPAKFHKGAQEVEFLRPTLEVEGKIRHSHNIQTDDFDFLKSVTRNTPKVSIPSPTMLHFHQGRKGVDQGAYPDMEGFFADLAAAFRAEVAALAEHGCTYLQLDDTNLAFLCDPIFQERARAIGEDPDELPRHYARLINDSIRERPAEMAVCIHLCRGNFQSAWLAEGGYDPVAEVLFSEMEVDGFFLEYDDDRSGGFEPLRFVPKGKKVVLGLITTKVAQLESKDLLKGRIAEAARYMEMEDLALSPQCGFSSTVEGNAITPDDQLRKLNHVVELAAEVWG